MARVCQVTQKRTQKGRKYSIRGIAKKKKGIGLNITGKTLRTFKPNLVKKRFWFEEEGRFVTIRTSSEGMRTIDKLGLAAVIKKLRKNGQKL